MIFLKNSLSPWAANTIQYSLLSSKSIASAILAHPCGEYRLRPSYGRERVSDVVDAAAATDGIRVLDEEVATGGIRVLDVEGAAATGIRCRRCSGNRRYSRGKSDRIRDIIVRIRRLIIRIDENGIFHVIMGHINILS